MPSNTGSAGYSTEIIRAPNGKEIACASKGSTLVPYDKVRVWGAGKVERPPMHELRRLQEMKQKSRKLFDQDPNHASRLEELIAKKRNYQRSESMGRAMKRIGLDPDSPEDHETIISHLLSVGEKITEKNRVWNRSEFDGPAGKMIILSTWKILPNEKKYLATMIYQNLKGD